MSKQRKKACIYLCMYVCVSMYVSMSLSGGPYIHTLHTYPYIQVTEKEELLAEALRTVAGYVCMYVCMCVSIYLSIYIYIRPLCHHGLSFPHPSVHTYIHRLEKELIPMEVEATKARALLRDEDMAKLYVWMDVWMDGWMKLPRLVLYYGMKIWLNCLYVCVYVCMYVFMYG